MTPTTLQTVGRALYGPCWQREMARQLDVSSRTVNRWATGVHAIPEGVRDELRGLCLNHAEDLKVTAYYLGEVKEIGKDVEGDYCAWDSVLNIPTNTDTKKDASDRHKKALKSVSDSPVVWNDKLGGKSDD